MKLKRRIFYAILCSMLLFAQHAQGKEPKQHHHQSSFLPLSGSGLKAQLSSAPGIVWVSITPAYSALKGQLNTKIQLMFY